MLIHKIVLICDGYWIGSSIIFLEKFSFAKINLYFSFFGVASHRSCCFSSVDVTFWLADLEMLQICQSCPVRNMIRATWVNPIADQLVLSRFGKAEQIRRLVTSVFAGHWPKSISAIPPCQNIFLFDSFFLILTMMSQKQDYANQKMFWGHKLCIQKVMTDDEERRGLQQKTKGFLLAAVAILSQYLPPF